MNNETYFTETQRFRQWWVWILLLTLNGFCIYGIFQQVIGGVPFGSKPMSDVGMMIMTISILLFSCLFLSLKLETKIKSDGIYVRFFPFHFKFKYYSYSSISKLYLRQYKPIREFGGWGIRYGFSGKGKAFNVSGNEGLQIEFLDSKKILIGTKKSTEIKEVLAKINQLNN